MIQVYKTIHLAAGGSAIMDMYIDSAEDLPAGGVVGNTQGALGSSAIDVSTGTEYRLNSSGVWINQTTHAKTIQITQQPENAEAIAGDEVTFTVAASGYELTYKWQSSSDGTTWTDISGATSASYTFTTAAADNEKSYHCVVTDGDSNSATSNAAVLAVTEPESEPADDQADDTEENTEG